MGSHLNTNHSGPGIPVVPSSLPQFVYRSISHHHCGLRIRTGGGVGIGDGDPAKWLSADSCRISRAAGRVTVGPAIYGNTRDISVEIKQPLGEHAAEMTPDFLFIILKLQR